MNEPFRILIHTELPEPIAAKVAERHPGAEITVCDSFAGLPKAAECDPHAAFSDQFEGGAYPRDALMNQPSLGFVHVSGAGINHLAPWDTAKVQVCNAGGVQDEGMAQFAIARLIAMNCNFFRYHDQQKDHTWKAHDVPHSTGGTLTVVGLGRIGQACARVAHALGMKVHGVRARPEPCENVACVVPPDRMHEVLALSDYVIVVTPLTDATRGMLDASAFAAMKPGVMFHDMSRGGVVDEDALVSALASGHVRAASRDVFAEEPLPAESPLWDVENLHITPHNAGMITGEDYDRLSTLVFLDNLDRFVRGEPLINVTDPVRGY
jgi:phosphoglycerate dehydrogenase-like enzyme